ncbi:hypothetical protein [Mesorhizobium sp. M00.F.Ca.ET.216.01.1.1]|uniref:hypothetical protein n=1 Tax=Mesorhizobium sp. M00.F.Ca.ET.216.01.1.1 TaxID=2500528 RepID=UPI000FD6E8F7|nr:hypothetical protein [Mesorhizobium sp. M00.F.Ca.ET.216.01.1.1]TGQ29828.1 hypothetical protein EN859_032725 [Mesorhizobium sp. M00.F.Ca.ET.216.01.1.1]
MAKRDRAGQKPVAEAVRELIGTEDNRLHLHKLLRLAVVSELTPTLESLLESIDRARQEESP